MDSVTQQSNAGVGAVVVVSCFINKKSMIHFLLLLIDWLLVIYNMPKL